MPPDIEPKDADDPVRPREHAREQSVTDLEQTIGDREQLLGDRDQTRIDVAQTDTDTLRMEDTGDDDQQSRLLADRQARIDREQLTRDVSQAALDHGQEGRDHQQHALDEARDMLELPTKEQPKVPDANTIRQDATDRARATRERAEASLLRARAALERAEAAEARARRP